MSGPVPYESDPAVAPEYLVPGTFPLTALSISGTVATFTASDANFGTISISPNFVTGQLIRFHIPQGYGTYQLDGVSAIITSIPTTDEYEAELQLPSTQSLSFNAFVPSPSAPFSYQTAQVSAIGDVNTASTGVLTSILNVDLAPSGSFQNISPFST